MAPSLISPSSLFQKTRSVPHRIPLTHLSAIPSTLTPPPAMTYPDEAYCKDALEDLIPTIAKLRADLTRHDLRSSPRCLERTKDALDEAIIERDMHLEIIKELNA